MVRRHSGSIKNQIIPPPRIGGSCVGGETNHASPSNILNPARVGAMTTHDGLAKKDKLQCARDDA